ncbi:MobF family relaxase, partial [Pantoea sp. BAV 3049]|uniref:MobF family relaxase n=1 Tax=Pantoea sp. BAV 3049 TaxID=2654188 RepID=UPI0018EECC70
MLSVSTVKSAGGAGNYYTAEDNYYFLGEQSTEWYGTGAESLGLEGPVDKAMFTDVLEGKLPDGTDLSRMENGVNKHRPGYDLTFSAPKSVSVLALVCGDEFLIEAHNRAVQKTLDEVEKLATTRTMQNGVSAMEATGNLLIACFMHDTSRNLDPQLHTHAVVINATLAQGGWKTLSSDTMNKQGFTDQVWAQQVSIGMLYRGFLRQDLEQAGYPIIATGERGEWDIAGVPVKEFSSRRQEILDAVGENASARAKSMAALDSRKKKEFSEMESVRNHWQEKLHDTGFKLVDFRYTVSGNVSCLQTDKEQHSQVAGQPVLYGKKADGAVGAAERPELESVVADAIARLSSKSVRFTYDSVLTGVLTHIPVVEGVFARVREAVDHAISRGSMLAVDRHQTLFTSAEHLRDEQRLIQVAAGLAERNGSLQAPSGERGVMAQLADANRAVTLVNVRGGQAYLQQFSESVLQLAEKNDRPLVVVAADGGSLKRQSALFGDNGRVTLTTAGQLADNPLPENALVMVSEAERFSTTAMHDVLKSAGMQGATTIVADTHARRTTGFATQVLKAAGVKSLTATATGDDVSVTLVQKDTVNDRLTVAARYYAQETVAGKRATVQAGNAKVRSQLTGIIRDVMVEEGRLGRVLGEVTVREPVWLDAATRNDRSKYREGMVLEHHTGRGLMEDFTITGVSEKHNLLTLSDAKGRTQGLKISEVDSHYRLFREKKLELREGERLRTTAEVHPKAGAGETLTVTGVKAGRWLFKDRLVMENADGQRLQVNMNAPLYAGYGYTEAFGATRSSSGSVIAVLSGKDVSDTTLNMLKRSGDSVIAFTPLDEKTIEKRLDENRPSVTVTQGVKSLAGEDDLADALRALEARKVTHPERSVRLSIEKVTGTGVTFSSMKVLADVMETDRQLSPERTGLELQRLQEKGDIIPLGAEQGATGLFISRENFSNELTILRHVAEGKNAVPPLAAGGLTAEQAGPLTDGQRRAANLILTSPDRITAIQGYAGVGKTTQFRTVATALNGLDNPPVIAGLAPTHRAVSELSAAGIPAQTISSFLSEHSQWQSSGETRDFSSTLFVIDESSMNGNAQLASLLTAISEGGGRAVLSGDRDQLKSLESGAPFALALERSAADVAVMKEIVRQTPALKPAIEAIIAGNVREAVSVAAQVSPETVPRLEGAYVPESSTVDVRAVMAAAEKEADTGELPFASLPATDITGLVAADFTGRTAQAREHTLIVTELNADRMQINAAVHERLKAQGVLGDSVTVPHLIRVGNSNADLGRMTFWEKNAGNTVRVGEQYFQVGASDAESGVIRLQGLDGADDRWFSPSELRKETVAVFERRQLEISTGEKVRLTTTDRERNIRASDMAAVTGVTPEGGITLDTGERTLTLDPGASNADRHLDYGYAVTTYSAQGASVLYIIALLGA